FFYSSFLSLIALINPAIVLPPFLGLVANATPAQTQDIAKKSCLIAAGILIVFVLLGDRLLEALGISQGALMIAGGMLLFRTAYFMVTGSISSPDDDETPAAKKKSAASAVLDVAVFPIAFPIITGPGAIAVVMGKLAANSGVIYQILMITAICAVIGA